MQGEACRHQSGIAGHSQIINPLGRKTRVSYCVWYLDDFGADAITARGLLAEVAVLPLGSELKHALGDLYGGSLPLKGE